MEDLQKRIGLAKADARELEALIADYLPFIKAEIARVSAVGLEYDDKLSLGTLVFMNCVRGYQAERGAFISYASVCIRNRLLDETRKLKKTKDNTLPFFVDDDAEIGKTPEEKAALAHYSQQQERQDLREEIIALSSLLSLYGLSFGELARICPKQKRSRGLCAQLAGAVVGSDEWYDGFLKTKQLPQAALARQFGISPKTIEKHRKYIVALVLVLSGDYPGIGTYIPGYREVDS